MFDFRLQVFHAVARRLNFTKAAAELFITQPAVTRHIHELEYQLHVKLFERNGTRIKLTNAGTILLQYTEALFALYRNMEFDLNSLSQRESGRLSIGASFTVAPYVLPPVLAAFRKKFNDIKIALQTHNTEHVEQSLLSKEIELGIIEGQRRNKAIKYTPFMDDALVLVTASSNKSMKKKAIQPGELRHLPLVLREPGSGTREIVEHALKRKGVKISDLQLDIQLGSTESIKMYLKHSDCFSFISSKAISRELQQNELIIVDINGLQIERKFNFIQLQGEQKGLGDLFIRYALQFHNIR